LYSYTDDKELFLIYIVKNDLRDQYTQTLQPSIDTWQESKPNYQWVGSGTNLSFSKKIVDIVLQDQRLEL
jgi:hypothetical protein